ncbi:MAG: glycosyltransferase family 2 protein [Myxococcaceae bacterium]|nr:glycosyltransferase family 2 protein [Myxococcaceae bacterium]
MTQPIDVLVVTVNYRSGPLTLRALESLAAERRAHPELALRAVVVENASGEEALLEQEISARFTDWVTLVVSPVNGGYGAGNNLGLQHAYAHGTPPRYVHFLNPDTEVRPGGVSELVRFLEAHPSACIAGGLFHNADGSDWPIAFRFPSALGELEAACELGLVSRLLDGHAVSRQMGREPTRVDWLPGASMMARAEMLERIGGFDEEYFLYYEETDLCRRAAERGWEVWYVPASRVMHIAGQSTGVTARDQGPRRLPRYWWESRRRYFVKNHGYAYAALADLAFMVGRCVGGLKRVLKRHPLTPHLFRDFLRDSVLLPYNRNAVTPERTAVLARGASGGAR